MPPDGRFWSVNQNKFQKLVDDNRIWFGKKGDGIPRLKAFFSEVQSSLRPNTIWFHKEVGHNQEGRQELKKLFDDKGYFDGPKPVRLLKQILHISNTKDSIILDFFSGSTTTAHATYHLNSEDSGNRKFIQVQLPEATDEKSEAYKVGYRNICEIGKEQNPKSSYENQGRNGCRNGLWLPCLSSRQQQYARCILQTSRLCSRKHRSLC